MGNQNKKPLQINPEIWQGREGSDCRHCGNKYKKQECVSLCNCPLYCHDQCFLIQFYPNLKEGQTVQCQVCMRNIDINANYETEWKCRKDKKAIGLLILIVILAIVTVVTVVLRLIKINGRRKVSLDVMIAIIVLFLAAIIIMVFCSVRKRVPKTCHITVNSPGSITPVVSNQMIYSDKKVIWVQNKNGNYNFTQTNLKRNPQNL